MPKRKRAVEENNTVNRDLLALASFEAASKIFFDAFKVIFLQELNQANKTQLNDLLQLNKLALEASEAINILTLAFINNKKKTQYSSATTIKKLTQEIENKLDLTFLKAQKYCKTRKVLLTIPENLLLRFCKALKTEIDKASSLQLAIIPLMLRMKESTEIENELVANYIRLRNSKKATPVTWNDEQEALLKKLEIINNQEIEYLINYYSEEPDKAILPLSFQPILNEYILAIAPWMRQVEAMVDQKSKQLRAG